MIEVLRKNNKMQYGHLHEKNKIKEVFTPGRDPLEAPIRHNQNIGTFQLFLGEECIYEGVVNPFMAVEKKDFWDAVLEVLTAWVYLFQ